MEIVKKRRKQEIANIREKEQYYNKTLKMEIEKEKNKESLSKILCIQKEVSTSNWYAKMPVGR